VPAERERKQLPYLEWTAYRRAERLTDLGPLTHDALVFRMCSLVLAMAIAVGLPVRHATSTECTSSFHQNDESTQTERPPQSPDLAPQAVAGTARTWVAGHIHDVLAPESLSLNRINLSDAPPLANRFRLRSSPPLRTFPLLI